MTLCCLQRVKGTIENSGLFYSACLRRKLGVNVKSKVIMVLEKQLDVCDFRIPYWITMPIEERCEVVLGGERLEKIRI